MDYSALRQFADSWGLVYMFAVFLGVIVLLLLPGAKKNASDAASIPFREDD